MTIYSFDVLPIHERPYRLETFTGWLRRLGAMNFLPSMDALVTLCFPRQSRRVARQQVDYPPLAIADVARVTHSNAANVYATTFYHLGCKFARSPHPQSLSRFLAGMIAPHLRYCPACVGETGYYRLTWRFTILNGCHEHYCKLLDHCEHCKATIPLFCAPFAVGHCLNCGTCLSDNMAPALSDQAYEQVNQQTKELIYLLTPQLWETKAVNVIVRLGAEFTRLRLVKRQTIAEVGRQLGTTESVIEGIERGNVRGRGASFHDYLVYAKYLNVSVVQLVHSIVVPDSEVDGLLPFLAPPPTPSKIRQDVGEGLLQAVQEVVQQLK
jgi:hypothetical protein